LMQQLAMQIMCTFARPKVKTLCTSLRCRSAPSIQKSARMLLDDSREIVIQRR
jgi:hypothetical protein